MKSRLNKRKRNEDEVIRRSHILNAPSEFKYEEDGIKKPNGRQCFVCGNDRKAVMAMIGELLQT